MRVHVKSVSAATTSKEQRDSEMFARYMDPLPASNASVARGLVECCNDIGLGRNNRKPIRNTHCCRYGNCDGSIVSNLGSANCMKSHRRIGVLYAHLPCLCVAQCFAPVQVMRWRTAGARDTAAGSAYTCLGEWVSGYMTTWRCCRGFACLLGCSNEVAHARNDVNISHARLPLQHCES